MTTHTLLLPAAEHVLERALAKALTLVQEGSLEAAERTLGVAIHAADLLEETERETLT
jgi:hypothetical protein